MLLLFCRSRISFFVFFPPQIYDSLFLCDKVFQLIQLDLLFVFWNITALNIQVNDGHILPHDALQTANIIFPQLSSPSDMFICGDSVYGRGVGGGAKTSFRYSPTKASVFPPQQLRSGLPRPRDAAASDSFAFTKGPGQTEGPALMCSRVRDGVFPSPRWKYFLSKKQLQLWSREAIMENSKIYCSGVVSKGHYENPIILLPAKHLRFAPYRIAISSLSNTELYLDLTHLKEHDKLALD